MFYIPIHNTFQGNIPSIVGNILQTNFLALVSKEKTVFNEFT